MIASILILIGIQNFWANSILVAIIAGAIATVQFPKAISEGAFIAGLERDLMILAGCVVSAAFGPGAFANAKTLNEQTLQLSSSPLFKREVGPAPSLNIPL